MQGSSLEQHQRKKDSGVERESLSHAIPVHNSHKRQLNRAGKSSGWGVGEVRAGRRGGEAKGKA